ncbi:MAG: competence protein [Caldibacillus debilis]|uniref:Competence protein n=1 Tax=Caldibacillus debilis TaxID=301148 RepID=A0A3E0K4F7_9BACI|nr:competence protein ComK [Caldibacillus debilis]MBY6273273.1 competence protein [Bacillaceae bacterium]OUM83536.1 MAG: hypothetical protein BAA03_09475 [Caldibacillus debilis]REJ18102.1 MAG: competence protein [Caldibacillus debilis]REJ27864.1 MAG: competence protein [Caldibacillus debilis]
MDYAVSKDVTKDNGYHIRTKTYAIKPWAFEKNFSVVFDEDGIFLVEKKPIRLIEEACIIYGSSLSGRRTAVIEQFDYPFKTPIPISPEKYIFAYPSASITSPECEWFFANNILHIANNTNAYGSVVTFRNGTKITSATPPHLLKKQLERTALCMIMLVMNNRMEYQRLFSKLFEIAQ